MFRWPWEPDPAVAYAAKRAVEFGDILVGEVRDCCRAIVGELDRKAGEDSIRPNDETCPCPGCGKRDSVIREHVTEDVYRAGVCVRILRGSVRLCLRCGELYCTAKAGPFKPHAAAMGQAPPDRDDAVGTEVERSRRGLPKDDDPPTFLTRPEL